MFIIKRHNYDWNKLIESFKTTTYYRWFTLKSTELCYYDNDEENAKCRGAFAIKSFVDVSDVTEKENGIDIVISNNKILQVAAESSEDSNDWYRYVIFKFILCNMYMF